MNSSANNKDNIVQFNTDNQTIWGRAD